MKLTAIHSLDPNTPQIVLFCEKGKPIASGISQIDELANQLVKSETFSGDEGEVLPLITPNQVCILVGAGEDASTLNHRKIAVAVKTALSTPPITPKKATTIQFAADSAESVRALVDGIKIGLYQWKKYVKKDEKYVDINDFDISIVTTHPNNLSITSTIADGVTTARNLGNENADTADSEHIEQTIRSICEGRSICTVTVLNKPELEEHGFGLHLAVNRGSHKEPKLIIVDYKGGDEGEPYTALIGKGITFDTGGLNLKPTGSMEDMRMDMCGSAAVIGTLQNALKLNIRRNVLFVVGCAENSVSSYSYKPGDIYRGYSGMTVEIGNTDAEGRLVLADANSYIARNYKPDSIINIATLTGAVVIALGFEYTGMMSSDDELAQMLLNAAGKSDDRAWRLPIYEELKEHVKSDIADIKNTGIKRCAGSISAGEFLRQFVHCESKETKWAHLDIAGTAKPDSVHGYLDTNATGSGVRLLTHYLLGA
jgi:leucyl aminopeptidase